MTHREAAEIKELEIPRRYTEDRTASKATKERAKATLYQVRSGCSLFGTLSMPHGGRRDDKSKREPSRGGRGIAHFEVASSSGGMDPELSEFVYSESVEMCVNRSAGGIRIKNPSTLLTLGRMSRPSPHASCDITSEWACPVLLSLHTRYLEVATRLVAELQGAYEITARAGGCPSKRDNLC